MRNVVYESPFFHIHVESKNNFLYFFYTKLTSSMSEEGYKNDLLAYIDVVKEHKVKNVLGNMTEFHYTIAPEMQKWIDENVFAL